MLLVLRDAFGQLTAVVQAFLRDERGLLDPSGRLVWLEQLEVSDGVDTRAVMRAFMRMGLEQFPHATAVYWVRRAKDGGRRTHSYTREQIERMGRREAHVAVAV